MDFPHSFTEKTFKKPTDCKVCGKLLMGIYKQGVACKVCGVATHKKCKTEANSKCPCKEKLQFDGGFESSSLLAHEFNLTTFGKPTDCVYCKKLLVGVYKQGLKCKACGIACHKKCMENVNNSMVCDLGEKKIEKKKKKKKTKGPLLDLSDPEIPSPENPHEEQEYFAVLENEQSPQEKKQELAVSNKQTLEQILEKKIDEIDSAIDKHFEEYNRKAQNAIDTIEKQGVANTIANGIKSGANFFSNAFEKLANEIETNQPRAKEKVIVDENLLEGLNNVGEGAKTVGNLSVQAFTAIKDATVYGANAIAESEFGKELASEMDPTVKQKVADGLAGTGQVLNQFSESVYAVGASGADNAVRVSSHLYGDDVAKATQSSCDIIGGTYKAVSITGGIRSGATLLQAPIRTAPTWAKSTTVLNGSMYASVFSYLDIKLAQKYQIQEEEEQQQQVDIEPKVRAKSLPTIDDSQEYEFDYDLYSKI